MVAGTEINDLREKLQQARSELFDEKVAGGEHRKSTVVLKRKAKSLEREMIKARAKIKRLEAKHRGKAVDEDLWSEYSDDI